MEDAWRAGGEDASCREGGEAAAQFRWADGAERGGGEWWCGCEGVGDGVGWGAGEFAVVMRWGGFSLFFALLSTVFHDVYVLRGFHRGSAELVCLYQACWFEGRALSDALGTSRLLCWILHHHAGFGFLFAMYGTGVA